MTTTVIIDDSDPSIVYSPGWTSGGATGSITSEYNATVHEAASNGLKLNYVFKGTRISVYGTLDSPLTKGVATSSYAIDNEESLTNFTGGNLQLLPDLQSHLLFYQSPTLSNGSHSLTITISNITNGSPKYYLDFFTVDTEQLEATSQVIVDDTSPDIQYVGNWTDSHAFNEYLTTDHNAPNTGNANATYVFNGTSISVYGSIITDNDPPTQIDFYIDSKLVTRYTAPPTGIISRNLPLFSNSGLADGSHTLVIASTSTAQWWFDYLIYSPTSDAVSSPSSGAVQDGNTGTKTPLVGAIVGGVIGGAGLLLCIGALLLILRRRRRQAAILDAAAAPESLQFPTTTNSRTPKEKANLVAAAPVVASAPRQSRGVGSRAEIRSDTNSARIVSATGRSATDLSSTQQAEIGREVDGGVRLASGDSEDDHVPSVLPPSYARY